MSKRSAVVALNDSPPPSKRASKVPMAPKVTPTKKKASPLVAAISAALLKGARKSKGGTTSARERKAPARRDKR